MGLALLDRVGAERENQPRQPQAAQDQYRLDRPNDPARAALVPRSGDHPGRRWGLGGGQTGAALLSAAPSGHLRLALAAGCRSV